MHHSFHRQSNVLRSYGRERSLVFVFVYVIVPGKRDHLGNFFKIELLLQQERVGFELQNALHISDESKVERSYSR